MLRIAGAKVGDDRRASTVTQGNHYSLFGQIQRSPILPRFGRWHKVIERSRNVAPAIDKLIDMIEGANLPTLNFT